MGQWKLVCHSNTGRIKLVYGMEAHSTEAHRTHLWHLWHADTRSTWHAHTGPHHRMLRSRSGCCAHLSISPIEWRPPRAHVHGQVNLHHRSAACQQRAILPMCHDGAITLQHTAHEVLHGHGP